MWRILALGIALALLVAPSSSAASERRIAEGITMEISAYRGWLLWTQYEPDGLGRGVVLWRGSRRPFHAPGADLYYGSLLPRLGSDARGRSVVIYMRCRDYPAKGGQVRDCDVVRQSLATAAERPLLHADDQTDLQGAELSQGDLAVGRGDTSEGIEPDLFLRRPGSRERRLSGDRPLAIDMEGERLVYSTARRSSAAAPWRALVRSVDLRTSPPRYRTLASAENDPDPDGPAVDYGHVATDGRYAYWMRHARTGPGDSFSYEVFRASLGDRRAPVARLRLEHPVQSIALAAGRLYYTTPDIGPARGVYEVSAPAWEGTGQRPPVH
jgi:hypothetical protein